MKKVSVTAVLVAVGLALTASVALADDPLATVKTDIAKLQSDVQTKHDAVVADAGKVESDAKSLAGSSDPKAARATIKADAQKLTSDWRSLVAVCLSDRAKLRNDITAARSAGAGNHGELALLVGQANLAIRATNLDMRAAVARAHKAVVDLRLSFKKARLTAPPIPTPTAPSTP